MVGRSDWIPSMSAPRPQEPRQSEPLPRPGLARNTTTMNSSETRDRSDAEQKNCAGAGAAEQNTFARTGYSLNLPLPCRSPAGTSSQDTSPLRNTNGPTTMNQRAKSHSSTPFAAMRFLSSTNPSPHLNSNSVSQSSESPQETSPSHQSAGVGGFLRLRASAGSLQVPMPKRSVSPSMNRPSMLHAGRRAASSDGYSEQKEVQPNDGSSSVPSGTAPNSGAAQEGRTALQQRLAQLGLGHLVARTGDSRNVLAPKQGMVASHTPQEAPLATVSVSPQLLHNGPAGQRGGTVSVPVGSHEQPSVDPLNKSAKGFPATAESNHVSALAKLAGGSGQTVSPFLHQAVQRQSGASSMQQVGLQDMETSHQKPHQMRSQSVKVVSNQGQQSGLSCGSPSFHQFQRNSPTPLNGGRSQLSTLSRSPTASRPGIYGGSTNLPPGKAVQQPQQMAQVQQSSFIPHQSQTQSFAFTRGVSPAVQGGCK